MEISSTQFYTEDNTHFAPATSENLNDMLNFN